jgi:hypothetical protein
MPSPGEEVVAFLRDQPVAPGRELDAAIAYAALMADELRASAADWQATAEMLQQLKCRQDAGVN